MPARPALFVPLLAAGSVAYPKLLECASDADTRLSVGSMIMGAPVHGFYAGQTGPLSVSATAAASGATTFRISTTDAVSFIVRVADGAGTLSSANSVLAAKCDTQLYTAAGTSAAAAGDYDVLFTPAAGYTADTAGLTIGYAPAPSGVAATPQVTVATYPATPAPAPTPPREGPTMVLDDKACRGTAGAATGGNYTLRVTAKGAKGYAYSCSAGYDPQAEVADKDCNGWLPDTVLSGKENLDVTLEGLDAAGKVAVCMQWHLTFDGNDAREGAWYPKGTVPADMDAVRARMKEHVALRKGSSGDNNPATRALATAAYLDSMTYVSHKCVPKAENDLLYSGSLGCTAFPPQAKTNEQFLLSHKLLAVSSMIHSIDRKCAEAWDIPIPLVTGGGSCVPTVPGFPHCHTSCVMTWNLAPGGVASWGMSLLNHHIPSPTLALGQYDRVDVPMTYNDVGCGGK